jgi:P4 family phage/plasmid primase-like protien
LSVSSWERLKNESVRTEPGAFENVEQTDTDTGFGKHFIREYGSFVRYNPDTQCWLYYEQGAWREDRDGVVVIGLMKEMFLERQAEAEQQIAALRPRWESANIEDRFFENGNPKATGRGQVELNAEERSLGKAWFKAKADYEEALSGQSTRRANAALEMARTEDGIAVYTNQWDKNPFMFNTFAHTVNLQEAVVKPHQFTDLLTMQSLIDLNPGAPCRQFERVLKRSLPDASVREYLQDYFGLCLSGLMTPEILIFLGEGANGKGLIVRVISGILGSYAGKCSMSSFMTSNSPTPGGARSDLSNLRGKRLVTAAEANRKVTLDMEMLKDWTGGEEFSARDLYEQAKKGQFKPQGKLILSMNNPPRITDQSHATWRRLRYIEFNVIIPASDRNENLAQELLENEGGGIFNWALKGWV